MAALAKLDLGPASEILLVDQTEIPFDIAPWRTRIGVPLRLIHLEEKGLAPARNAALGQTEADIVLFIDDDVIPDAELVQQHLATYRQYPRALGVAGAELLPSGRGPGRAGRWLRRGLTRLVRHRYPDYLDDQGEPAALITKSGLFLCDFAHPRPCRVMTPRGCNMSFRRAALLAIGGFDERFLGPRRDESDLALRLLAAFPDGELRFNPRAKLIHLMAPTGGCRSEKGRAYHKRVIECELHFARRHLRGLGRALFSARLALRQSGSLLRHPSLVRSLWARGDGLANGSAVPRTPGAGHGD